jgi:hypothetical protein
MPYRMRKCIDYYVVLMVGASGSILSLSLAWMAEVGIDPPFDVTF